MKLGCHCHATELGVGTRRILLLPPSASLFSEHLKPISTNSSSSSSFRELLLLLDSHREWMLPNPASEIHKISLTKVQQQQAPFQFAYSNNLRPTLTLGAGRDGSTSFYVVRDDLLHPLVNGNKARKLDALLPILQQYSATDVVTCGGCQSAHAAALAVSCVERGIRPHLLLRGEQPQVPTGYNLVSLMYGNTTYISRSLYARREEMLNKHAELVAGSSGSIAWVDDILGKASNNCTAHLNGDGTSVLRKSEGGKDQRRVVVVNEGAGAAVGLLGVVRLVRYLSQFHLFGTEQHINIVLDAGTGTTAVGLALGAICLGLPWKVTAVMLADTIERYKEREKCLISSFKRIYQLEFLQTLGGVNDSIVHWVERIHSRKFGNVLEGEIELCRQIARQTGILVDPVYTLAAWEHAVLLSLEQMEDAKVVMLHTGGTLGMFGLAQRYPSCFHSAEQAT